MKALATLLLAAFGGIALAQQTRGLRALQQPDPAAPLKSGKAYALIIGTNNYADPSWPHLENPERDAQTIADELRTNFGYEAPVLLKSPAKLEVETQLRAFIDRKYDPSDSVFIFVAGHGKFDEQLQQGYLVFKDSRKDDPLNSSYTAHLDLRQYVDRIPAKRILLVIDACFGGTIDDAVAKRGEADISYPEASKVERLARKANLTTRLFLTSGGKEYVADGRPGANSPFATQILRALRNYDNSGLVTFDDIWQKAQLVQGQQPVYNWFGSSDTDADFWFVTSGAKLAVPAPATSATGAATRGAAPNGAADSSPQMMQTEFTAVQNSNDLAALKAFVAIYKGKPEGQSLVALIENRISLLSPSEFHYNSAHDRDLLPLLYKGKWTLFNRRSQAVLATEYGAIEPFSEGLAIVRSQGRFGAIDKQGKVAIPVQYQSLLDSREGLMRACTEAAKCGYLDSTGRFAIEPVYRSAAVFSNGLARVVDNAGHAWFIDHHGNQLLDATGMNAYFGEDTVGAVNENRQWGFKDRTGKWVIPPAYEAVGSYYRGRAPVKSAGNWLFIDTSGKVVAQSDADLIPVRPAKDPTAIPTVMVIARKGAKQGFVDNSGRWLLPPVWDAIPNNFVEGVAEVAVAGHSLWIDEVGNPVLNPDAPAPRARLSQREGLRYLFIPPGSFTMGCSPGDNDCKDNEKPAHAEQIATGFWLGETEVTQAAWKKIMGSDPPSQYAGDQLPVDKATAGQADAYCKAVGGRLPAAKEWEYAARGMMPGKWYSADLKSIAWHIGAATQKGTHPVAQKQPNLYGLYDMLGNVWEWTADDFAPGHREMRGGAWGNAPLAVRVSTRQDDERLNQLAIYNTGFRCAMNQ